MLNIKNNLGNFIHEYRGKQSLREFAAKCGISHTHLDSIEKGTDYRSGKPVRVTVDTLEKIAKAMNMSVNELLIESGEVEESSINKVKKKNDDVKAIDFDLDDDDIIILKLLKGMDPIKKKTIINFINTFK